MTEPSKDLWRQGLRVRFGDVEAAIEVWQEALSADVDLLESGLGEMLIHSCGSKRQEYIDQTRVLALAIEEGSD